MTALSWLAGVHRLSPFDSWTCPCCDRAPHAPGLTTQASRNSQTDRSPGNQPQHRPVLQDIPVAGARRPMSPVRRIACVLLPFAAGYYLSYLFRSINALIAGDLTAELGLSPSGTGSSDSVHRSHATGSADAVAGATTPADRTSAPTRTRHPPEKTIAIPPCWLAWERP